MTRRKRPFFALFASLLIVLMPGCDSLKGPEGPAGPNLTGDLVGFAELHDLSTGGSNADNSGITVTAESTDVTAVTRSDGMWVLSNLKTGTYTLAFSKTGYGTTRLMGYQFVGGGQAFAGYVWVFLTPGYTVTGLSASVSSGNITIGGSITGVLPASTRAVRIFFGATPSVSSDPKSYLYNLPHVVSSTLTTFSSQLAGATLRANGFSSGQTAYLVAYAENYFAQLNSDFNDPSTGRHWYPGLNPVPSTVVVVTVP